MNNKQIRGPLRSRSADAPQASHHFLLEIGGITVSLQSEAPGLKIEIDGVTKKFLVTEGDPEVRIKVKWGDLFEKGGGEKIFDSGILWQLYSEHRSYRFDFISRTLGPVPYKMARFDREFTSGEVCFHHPYFPSGQPLYPLDYPLDELLMVNKLAQGKGVEVHACGVVDSSGNGRLFVGQSGAGKSTMARLWQRDSAATVLSDDRIILGKEGTGFCMYGTPWHGEAELASPESAPLKSVYFLAKGIKNEMVPLKQSGAAGRLFACGFPPYYSPQGINFTLSFLEEIVQAVSCCELSFLPDRKVLDLIQEKP